MILVDTSVWIDHLRHGEPKLAHLLASALLTANTQLWTRDKRLYSLAECLGLAFPSR